jgi:hypothetical protein
MIETKGTKIAIFVGAVILLGLFVIRLVQSTGGSGEVVAVGTQKLEPSADLMASQPMPRSEPRETGNEVAESEAVQPQVSREQAEAFMQKHNRSAASLLAAYRALQDTNLLAEAVVKFPNDPQVQLALLNSDVLSPSERRHWLEAFKTSSPSNSLANYLSAAAYFNAGNQETALQDLLAAAGKGQFKDFTFEAMLDEQELLRFAGEDSATAMFDGRWGAEMLRMLVPMKAVANGIATAQSQYAEAGDSASAENLIQMGFGLAERIDSGDSGKFLISQLVGTAIEKRMLQQLDAATAYESLGGKTPQERLEELKQEKAELREIMKILPTAQATLTPEEWGNYYDRVKVYGELEAMRWLQQRTAAATSR